LLETFLNKLFTQCLFDSNFVLIEDIDGNSTPLVVPDETSTKDSLINWVHQIKAAQMPSWIGLPNNAEKVLLTERGFIFIYKKFFNKNFLNCRSRIAS